MRKKFCFLISALMLFSLIPQGAHAAGLANSLWISEANHEFFSINGINFEKDMVTYHYYGSDIDGDNPTLQYLNIFWTDYKTLTEHTTDYLFQHVTTMTPWWGIDFWHGKINNALPNKGPSIWVSYGYENQNPDFTLKDNFTGTLYVVALFSNGHYERQKINYLDCLTSSDYVEGAYCRLEKKCGQLFYWPYLADFGRLGDDSAPFGEICENDPTAATGGPDEEVISGGEEPSEEPNEESSEEPSEEPSGPDEESEMPEGPDTPVEEPDAPTEEPDTPTEEPDVPTKEPDVPTEESYPVRESDIPEPLEEGTDGTETFEGPETPTILEESETPAIPEVSADTDLQGGIPIIAKVETDKKVNSEQKNGNLETSKNENIYNVASTTGNLSKTSDILDNSDLQNEEGKVEKLINCSDEMEVPLTLGEEKSYSKEFPWWLLLLLLLGNMVEIWLFWPEKRYGTGKK